MRVVRRQHERREHKGLAYIISEKLFNTLPRGERKYWHPHNYEILSGQLVGLGLPDAAEKVFMTRKMNSYGKTWHVWMMESSGKPGHKLSFGDLHLAWSFNHDGELAPGMLEVATSGCASTAVTNAENVRSLCRRRTRNPGSMP